MVGMLHICWCAREDQDLEMVLSRLLKTLSISFLGFISTSPAQHSSASCRTSRFLSYDRHLGCCARLDLRYEGGGVQDDEAPP